MRRSTFSILWIAGLLAVMPATAQQQHVAVERKASSHPAKTDPFLSGAPFTFDQVLHLMGQDAIPLRRRKDAIQNRGVDFHLSAEAIDKLRAAGAADDMLDLIRSKARPAPPAAELVSKPAVGSISISCAPAECEVAVNGAPRGSTTNGTLELGGIATGNYVVDCSRNGYISRQNTVIVEENRAASVSAVLAADRVTQEAFGAALFKKMVDALGGEEGIKALSNIQATGSATILAREGSSIRWGLRMRNRPERALFQAKSGSIVHEVMFAGSEFTASKSLKGQDALDMPTAFGYVRDQQLAALIARLEKSQYRIVASQAEPAADAEFALSAEGGTDRISIGLDAESRPQRVRITTETGVGSMLITFSDYFRIEQSWYPKSMQVKADGQQHGIEVHFDTVELNPKLKDSDYKLKGKPFASLYN